MTITVTCAACGKSYIVDQRWAGKRTKCRSCGKTIRVPDILNGDDEESTESPDATPIGDPSKAQPVVIIADPTTSPKVRAAKIVKKKKRTPGWVAVALAFVFGTGAGIAGTRLYNLWFPPAHQILASPTVEIQIRFDGGDPPDATEIHRHTIDSIATALDNRGIRIKADSAVKAIATLHKVREVAITLIRPGAATAPGTPPAVHEAIVNIDLEFRDASGNVFWRDSKPGTPNLDPETMRLPEGKTLDQALQIQQWREAAERFAILSYPNASAVRDASIGAPTPIPTPATAATNPATKPK